MGDVALDAYGGPTLVVYQAHRQLADNRNWALVQVVATELPPERMLAAVRAEVAALDPQLVVHRAAAMTEVVGRGVSRERFALVVFQISPWDPRILMVTALLLTLTGLIAAWLPARRASRVQPRVAS